MAQLQDYDEGASADHSHVGGGELMPAGDYVGQIIESDVHPNNGNTGHVMELTWELLNDGYKGRRVWQYINVKHTASAKAHEIGQRELANLKDVIGIPASQRLSDSVMLHNKPAGLKLKIEKANDSKYKDKNQVAAFFFAKDFVPAGAQPAVQQPAAGTQAPAYVAPAPTPPAPAAAPAANTPPWLKKA